MPDFVSLITQLNSKVNAFVWGPVMIAFMMLTGLYFTVGSGFFQIRKIGLWLSETLLAIFRSKDVHDKRDPHTISQFQALSTALAGTIGTGNIVGVATAIVAGGTGAIFWMWVSAFVGMMTKFAENVLGNHYRYKDEKGAWVGGPMVYIERGLHCKWLAVLFALFCMIASFGIGNMTQANSICGAVTSLFPIAPLSIGIIVALLTGLVILGGIKRIASVTEKFVPLMAVVYTVGGLAVLVMNRAQIPAAFSSIFTEAFDLRAAGGGIGGYAMMHAVKFGFARGIFSNEAGLGSSVIVNSASNVKEPVQQGMWGIFEVFADTIIMCTITSLVILTSGALSSGKDGAALSITAFSTAFGSAGSVFVSVAITCFAFSTILGWAYYGEQALAYLVGPKPLLLYKIVYIFMTCIGCVANLELVWSISDTFNGLMAIPNLIAIVMLSGKVFSMTKEYLVRKEFLRRRGE